MQAIKQLNVQFKNMQFNIIKIINYPIIKILIFFLACKIFQLANYSYLQVERWVNQLPPAKHFIKQYMGID